MPSHPSRLQRSPEYRPPALPPLTCLRQAGLLAWGRQMTRQMYQLVMVHRRSGCPLALDLNWIGWLRKPARVAIYQQGCVKRGRGD